MRVWQLLLLLAGLLVFGVFAALAFNFLVLPRVIHRNAVIQMPDLRGLDLDHARLRVADLRLDVDVERSRAHPTLREGLILEQSPEPQAPIRRGRVVRVVTSSGPPAGDLPSLVGLSPRQAEVTLQREAYRVGRVVRVRRPDVTVPTVVAQNPMAGRDLRKGMVVDLVVAEPAPPHLLRMPDLRGVPIFQAQRVVTEAGCVLAPVTYERTTDRPPNLVLDQSPTPGQRVERGVRVELVASSH
ncbi:MAG: PASTA domain-containing protein [Candidatus Krumholzibacteriia bacterium]